MFRLVADPASQRDVNNLASFFNNFGLRISSQARADVEQAVRDGFAQNFNRQASAQGPWARLSPFTQAQRAALGFPPARPILQRTGSLRDSFVSGTHPQHYSRAIHSARQFVLEEASDDPRADRLQGGLGRNLPPRSVVDLMPDAEDDIGDAIDDMMTRLLRREGL